MLAVKSPQPDAVGPGILLVRAAGMQVVGPHELALARSGQVRGGLAAPRAGPRLMAISAHAGNPVTFTATSGTWPATRLPSAQGCGAHRDFDWHPAVAVAGDVPITDANQPGTGTALSRPRRHAPPSVGLGVARLRNWPAVGTLLRLGGASPRGGKAAGGAGTGGFERGWIGYPMTLFAGYCSSVGRARPW